MESADGGLWVAVLNGLKRINRLRRWFWQSPPCYEMRGRCFQLKERCMGYPALHRDFQRRTGYSLRLDDPQTFHQKITCLKIRRPPRQFVQAVNKATAKELALDWAARSGLSLTAARTLAVVDDPSRIPWDQLPERFVLKATHRSGANRFIDQRSPLDLHELNRTCRRWLDYPYGVFKHEWAYWSVPRRLLIEELIEPDSGAELLDYKFHMSRGACLMIQVNSGFRSGERRRSMVLPPWTPQPVSWLYPPPELDPVPPENFAEMMELAQLFSSDCPYIRVDLYSLRRGGRSEILFGEFTYFPGSGSEPVDPVSFDRQLGQSLHLSPSECR